MNISLPIGQIRKEKADGKEELRRPEERRVGETERKRKEAEERRKTGSVFVIKATSCARKELLKEQLLFITVLAFYCLRQCL